MKKKLLWIVLLIIIGFIVISSFYNITMFRMNSRDIYNENQKINITKAPLFWGEKVWEEKFSLKKSSEIGYSISTGFLSKNSKMEILDQNNNIVYLKVFDNNINKELSFFLEKGQYTLKLYYYKGIVNHIVFALNNKEIILSVD